MKTTLPKSLALTAAVLFATAAATSLLAQSSWNWNGNVSGNWSDSGGANWTLNTSGGSSLPQGYLNFPSGAGYLSNTNDFPDYSSAFQIYFNSGASSYSLYGNAIKFYDWSGTAAAIQNDSANTQTINFLFGSGNTVGININPNSGDLVINGSSSLFLDGPSQIRVNGNIGRTVTFNVGIGDGSPAGGTFALNGPATALFTAANTYTGDTFINSGTLRLSVNNGLASSFVRLGDVSGTAGANLNLDGGLSLTPPINVRSGSSGTMIIANTASTSGTATFSGNVYLDKGVTLYANSGGGITLSGTAIDLKAQTLTVDGSGTAAISGVLTNSTGSGALVKNGAGTLTLSGANANSGITTLNAGVLQLGNASALGTGGLIITGGSLDSSVASLVNSQNNTQSWGGNFTFVGTQNLSLGTGAVGMTASRQVTVSAGTLTVGGVISGSTFGLTKAGAGTFALSGLSTYTGGTTINAGILDLTGGGGGSGTIRGTATINATGTLRLSVGDATGYSGGVSSITPINITGGTLNVNTTANETLGNCTVNMTGGSITGVSGGNLDFFGGSSTLNALASATTSTISGVPISPLRQGNTTFTVAAGTTASGIDLDISSVIRTSPSGDASGAVLIKAGTGTMRLSAVNTFAKPITVSAGKLVGATGASCANSLITVNNAATNGVQVLSAGGQWTCAALTVAPGAAYGDFDFGSFTPSTTTAPLQVNGNVTFNGLYGIIVRNTTLAVGTYPLINYTGTLNGAPPTFPLSVPGGVVANISNNTGNKSLDLVVTSLSSPSSVFWTNTSGVWDINTTFNWTNSSGASAKYLDGSAVVFNNPASASTVTLNTTVNPAAVSNGVAFNNTANYTVSGSGAIAGPVGLTKAGSGALTLATPNTYSGGTILSAGTLYASTADSAFGTGPLTVAGSSTLSTISGGGARTLANPVTVATGQTLSLNAANANLTLNGSIGGGGSITPASTGTTTLGGVNPISNALAVNGGGTLVLATGSATTNLGGGITVSTSGSGNTLTIQSGAALAGLYLRTGDNGSGNNSVVNQLGGTVTLTTSSSTDIRLGHWSTTGNSYSLLGGTLSVPNTVFNNGWDGASTFYINGGTASLLGLANGASGHGGSADTVILSSGTLNIGASGITQNGAGAKAFNLGPGTVGALAAWTGSATMSLLDSTTGTTFDTTGGAITLSGAIGGTGSLKKLGSNALTLSGANTYAGTTVINAGALQYSTPGSATMIGAVSGSGSLAFGTGTTLNIGGSGNVASLSVGTPLTLSGGSVVYDLNSPGSADVIAMTGSPALTLSGTTTISPVGAVPNGTYTLISGAGTITGTAANLALATSATNSVRGIPAASFTVSSPTVSMTVSGEAPTNVVWQGTTSGTWDVNTTANWTNTPGGTSDKFFNADIVTFNDTALATANGTNVTVSATVYPGSVTFNNSSWLFGLGGGSIAGGGGLTKSGTAMVIISNANTFAGGTTINAGTVRVANASALGTGPLAMSGGTLDLNTNNLGVLTLSGTAGTITDNWTNETAAVTKTLTVNQLISNTFAGVINKGISNNIALVKNGGGYLTLSGANTYSGATTVNAGTLEIQNRSGNEGSITVAQGATLKYGYSTVGSGGYGQSVTINGNGVSDPAGFYILGGKTFNGNTLTLQNLPTTIHQYGSGTALIRGFDNNGTHLSVATSASGSTIDPLVGISCQGYGFTMNIASGVNTASGDLIVGGPISGTAGGTKGILVNVMKYGAGSAVFTNASTYANGLLVSAGSVILSGGNNRLPVGTGVSLGDGLSGSGVLVLNGVNQTLVNLVAYGSGTANAVVGGSPTTSTLTINNASANVYAGAIGGLGANQGNLALVKQGAGLLTLSGVLTYTGSTTISGGSVLASSLTQNDGTTLSVAVTAGSTSLAATNLTLGSSTGCTLAFTGYAGSSTPPVTVTNLTALGTIPITLAGTFTSGQYPLIQYVSGSIGGSGYSAFQVQQAGLPRGVVASLSNNVVNKTVDLIITANPLLWAGTVNGTWDINTTTNWTLSGLAATYLDNDNVRLDDTATGTTAISVAAVVSPFAVVVTNSAQAYSLGSAGGGKLAGSMILLKQGPGVLTLNASNSFSGGTTISGGAINLQQANGLGTGGITVASGAELELQGGFTTPALSLSLNGAGTNTTGALRNISGNSTYGGPITLSGAARVNSDSGILTLTNGVTAGANQVTLGGSGIVTISTTTISGSGGLVKDGSGTNIWNLNPNISSGGVTINAGTFQINNGNFGGTFTPLITVNQNGTLLGTGTHSTGGGTAVVVNKGTWLMDAEDYKQYLTMVDGLIGPGPNLVSAGADLRVGSGGGIGSWTWSVSNSVAGSVINAKLNTIGSGVYLTLNVARGAAASDLTVNGQVYGAGNITIAGNGITTLTATNTYSGWTTVSGGTLVVPTTQTGGGAFTNVDGTALGVNIITNIPTIPLSYLVLGTNTGGINLTFNNFVGSTNPPINATNLITAGTTIITVPMPNPRGLAVGQWPLIKYTGSIGGTGFGAFTLAPLPRGVVAILVNNTVNSSVDLSVLATDQITWNGNVSGLWDTNTTANWLWNGSATTYQEQAPAPGDGVLFDDTATGTTAVTLNQTVTPLAVVFNNTNVNYSLSGSGTNNTGLIKNGPGTLTNLLGSFAQTIALNAGAVEMQSGGDVGYTIASGATLRHGYNNPGGYNKNVTLNGNGVADTNGLYIKQGTTFSRNAMTIQTAPTTIRTYGTGGSATINGFDVNGDQLTVQPAASGSSVDPTVLFTTGSYGYALNIAPGANTATGDLAINGPFVGSGTAQVRGENQSAGLHKFGAGSLLLTGISTLTGGVAVNGGSVILSGGDNRLPSTTTVALGNGSASGKLILGGVNQTLSGLIVNGTGTANAVVGGAADNSTLTFTNTSVASTFAGTLGGTNADENNLALTKVGSGLLTLSGANTYTGPTVVANGTLALSGSGSIAASASLIVSNGATLDASVRSDGALSLSSTQTLSGDGLVLGDVAVPAGATVAPGSSALSTLSLNNGLTLAGNAAFRLNRTNAQSADRIAVAGAVTYGGTLTAVNTGDPLQAGDKFTLFTAGSYNASAFAVTNLPALDASLVWDTSGLTVDGSIQVGQMPSITTPPANQVVECASNVTFTAAAAGLPAPALQWSLNSSPVPGETSTSFTVSNVHVSGTVSVVASNAYGIASAGATFTVQDTQPPVVTLNGPNPMTVECHGTFTDPGATAMDACAGSLSVSVSGTVDPNSPGTYTLTYSATDPANNTGTATRTVNVVDTIPPVVTWSFTNLVLSADTNCQAQMPDVTGTNYILASDACSSVLTITQTPTNTTVLALGTNEVVLAVSDSSGNTAYSTNMIVVADQTAPVITMLGASPMTNECHSAFADPGATALDNCSGVVSVTTNSTVNADAVGIYTIQYVASDAAGNNATNTRTVYVVDTAAPVITQCAPPQTVTAGPGGETTLSNLTSLVVATDACSGSVNITQDPAAGTTIYVGTNTVVFYVDDGNGNTNTCSTTVTVVSAVLVPPTILGEGFLGDGTFQLTFSGPEGQTYKVVASPDVTTATGTWDVLTNGTFGAAPASFTDTSASGHPVRFYRVVSP